MTMGHVEVLAAERRRRWSRFEKEQLVAASFEPGMSASEVARSAGIHVSQLFRWRKQLCERVDPPVPALIPVEVAASPPPGPVEPSAAPARSRRRKPGLIEIELGGGRRLRVDRDVDAAALRRVLDALDGR